MPRSIAVFLLFFKRCVWSGFSRDYLANTDLRKEEEEVTEIEPTVQHWVDLFKYRAMFPRSCFMGAIRVKLST